MMTGSTISHYEILEKSGEGRLCLNRDETSSQLTLECTV
jgi:hypothetical protein